MNINNNLPEECIFGIFSELDQKSLAKCGQVCQKWKRIANDDQLWKSFFPNFDFPQGVSPKSFIAKCKNPIESVEKLKKRIELFINNSPLSEERLFVCEFPNSPESHISILWNKQLKMFVRRQGEPTELVTLLCDIDEVPEGTVEGLQIHCGRKVIEDTEVEMGCHLDLIENKKIDIELLGDYMEELYYKRGNS